MTRVLISAVLLILIWSVFGQTARFDFVNYDDNRYLYDEPHVATGFSWENVKWAFTTSHVGNWHPVTSLSLMLDVELFGVNAGAHHLVNVALHGVATLLLFLALTRYTGSTWRSAFVAAVFAIHPLKVESVAWISERKDVLSGVFFVLTLLAYYSYARERSARRYLVVALCLALGLMAKPMLISVPLVLLALDYWPLQRISDATELRSWLRLLPEKVPLLVLACLAAMATLWAQERALEAGQSIALSQRLGNAVASIWMYLWQTIWPTKLALFYPHPLSQLSSWTVLAGLIGLVALVAAVLSARKRHPYLLTGTLWFLLMLVPVLGIVQVGWQARADRYMYLPQIGLMLGFTWLVTGLVQSRPRLLPVVSGGAILLVALAGFTAWRQTNVWDNSEKLWRHALGVTERNDVALRGLGVELAKQGDHAQAVRLFREAIKLRPGSAELRVNLANALREQGQLDQSIDLYREVLGKDPRLFVARANLAEALSRADRFEEALAELEKLEAEKPNDASIQAQRAAIHARRGDLPNAIRSYRAALALQPGSAETLNNLAITLFRNEQVTEAAERWKEALRLNENSADVHNNLGVALMRLGRPAEAVEHWQRALELQPDESATRLTLAWVLATSRESTVRDGPRAVQLAEAAIRGQGASNPMAWRTLAAALAEAGRFHEAARAAEQAGTLAANADLAAAIAAEIDSYQSGVPLRE